MNVFVDRSYFIDALGADWTQRVLTPYREWTAALPPPLASVRASLIGQEIGNSNLVHFPWLVGEAFEAGNDLVESLVAANAFMLTYFLASDRMFDAPETADRATILLATLLHAELVRCYDRVAPAHAAPIWQRLIRDHVDGVMAEEQHHAAVRAGGPGLSLVAYERTSMLKNRYGMAAIELLAARTRQPDIAAVLRSVYDHIAIEIELDDDLKDWQEDLQAGRFTPTVQLLVEAAGSSRAEDVARALVTSTAVPDMLDRIDAHLAAAEALLREAAFPHLRLNGWLARHREANRRLRTFVISRQVSTALCRLLAR